MQAYVRVFLVAVVAITYVLCVFVVTSANPNDLALVTLDAATYDSSRTIIAGLEDRGFRVRHIFPPNHLIGEASDWLVEDLRGAAGVSAVETAALANASKRARSPAPDIFEQILIRLPSPAGTLGDWDPASGVPDIRPLAGCQLPPKVLEPSTGDVTNHATPTTPNNPVQTEYLFTSQYLIGRVVVAILLMESAGGTESWTTLAEDSAVAGIVAGADLLSRRAEEHDVNVSWVYEIHRGVPTSYEPIQGRPMPEGNRLICEYNWSFQWVREALGHVGYSCPPMLSEGMCWESAFRYATDLRTTYGADWAIAAFVVEAESKPPFHAFDGGLTAYQVQLAEYDPYCHEDRYQSPIIGLAYWSGVNGMDPNFGEGFAHEALHCFGAMDEYNTNMNGGYGCSGAGDCSLTSGYLHAPNGNCVYCPGGGVDCLMNDFCPFRNPAVCQYTLGQIGWRDTDGDGPVDAIDPHYMWSGIYPVAPGEFAPGDIVRIYTQSMEGPVKKFLCNEDNVDPSNPGVIWDCLNSSGYHVWPTWYFATVNGGGARKIYTHDPDLSVKPRITNISFTGNFLTYRLEESFAYVRCFIYDESSGLLVGRPVWDKLRTADHTYTAVVDTGALSGPAIARFYAWRPDGGASDVTEFRIRVPKRGDINLNGIAGEVGDVVLFSRYFIWGNRVWDPVDSAAQIAATDVNADGVTRALADQVYLVRAATGDFPLLAKPSPLEQPTGTLQWHLRDDTLLVGWKSSVNAGGLLLQFNHTGGVWGDPILRSRVSGMTVMSHDDGRQLRVLISGMARGSRIPEGDGPILAIPVPSSMGEISLSAFEAADYWGNTIVVDSAWRGQGTAGTSLSQNTPNPFNSSTTVCFALPKEEHVTLTIYNVLGQHVATLVDGILRSGNHQVTWDGKDDQRHPLPSGVYFYSLLTSDDLLRRKMVVLK